jgi:hypothetical protein
VNIGLIDGVNIFLVEGTAQNGRLIDENLFFEETFVDPLEVALDGTFVVGVAL